MQNERYLRQSLIDWFPQDKVFQAHFALVGCGAVGNEVGKNLALLGVRNIDVFDFDKIEIDNLPKSILYRETDVGRYKADVFAQRLLELEPNLSVNAFNGNFWNNISIKKLKKYSSVICCVDNFEARIKMNQLCNLVGVDFINTGIDSRYIVAEIYPFSVNRNIPCYECTLSESVYENIRKRYSCGWLKKISYIEKKIPTTIITSSIAGALATSLSLRAINHEFSNSRRIYFDSITGISSAIDLVKNIDCPSCSKIKQNIEIIFSSRRIENTVRSISKLADDDIWLQTSEPILTKYYCVDCDAKHSEEKKLFKCAEDFDTTISTCEKCGQNSVNIEIKDSFSIKELLDNYSGFQFPCKYLLYQYKENTIMISMEEENESN